MDEYHEVYPYGDGRVLQRRRQQKRARRSYQAAGWGQMNASFVCKQCGASITGETFLSGVGHRNHCPNCLWSRHVDLYRAGDRLSACKGRMAPVALTTKIVQNRYGSGAGELMLVHCCEACRALSINRIAADDRTDQLLQVFRTSKDLDPALSTQIEAAGIYPIMQDEFWLVRRQLFGDSAP